MQTKKAYNLRGTKINYLLPAIHEQGRAEDPYGVSNWTTRPQAVKHLFHVRHMTGQ